MKIRSVLGVFMAIMLLSGCAGQAEPQETELPRAEETTEETTEETVEETVEEKVGDDTPDEEKEKEDGADH